MAPARLFDRYIVVDWSASARPTTGRDSIWIAEATDAPPIEVSNPATRREAADWLAARLERTPDDRTLVGVDVGLGYPSGTARRLGLAGAPAWAMVWRELARLVVEGDRNANNRFEVAAALNGRMAAATGEGRGPFWGCPPAASFPGLAPTKPRPLPIDEWRACEVALRVRGFRPFSMWQLLGAGSVGGQALTAIPVLHRLFERFVGRVGVWPFTTGLTAPEVGPGAVIVAETWPTAFVVDLGAHPVRDAAQVRSVADALRVADRRGELGAWFAPSVGAEERRRAESEEGWVLCPRREPAVGGAFQGPIASGNLR